MMKRERRIRDALAEMDRLVGRSRTFRVDFVPGMVWFEIRGQRVTRATVNGWEKLELVEEVKHDKTGRTYRRTAD